MAEQAALWLARRDRGLSPEEQDEYLQWLSADLRHPEELARHAAAFQRMMRLYEWQPGQSVNPNPDLFAPRARSTKRAWRLSLAAAAALLAVSTGMLWPHMVRRTSVPAPSYLRVNESRILPDGSIVELKDGSRIELAFSPEVRALRLTGEAHFTVAKDATPFVVHAGDVSVRAVGTAFNVRLDANEVDVLVTEGKVHLDRTAAESAPGASASRERLEAENSGAPNESARSAATEEVVAAELVAGQRATVPRSGSERAQVSDVTPAEIEQALAWQAPRLEFSETPLAVAIAEFNQRNRTRLVLSEPALGTALIGGTFRVDNVEGFVRLLEVTLDITVETRAGGKIILSRRR